MTKFAFTFRLLLHRTLINICRMGWGGDFIRLLAIFHTSLSSQSYIVALLSYDSRLGKKSSFPTKQFQSHWTLTWALHGSWTFFASTFDRAGIYLRGYLPSESHFFPNVDGLYARMYAVKRAVTINQSLFPRLKGHSWSIERLWNTSKPRTHDM